MPAPGGATLFTQGTVAWRRWSARPDRRGTPGELVETWSVLITLPMAVMWNWWSRAHAWSVAQPTDDRRPWSSCLRPGAGDGERQSHLSSRHQRCTLLRFTAQPPGGPRPGPAGSPAVDTRGAKRRRRSRSARSGSASAGCWRSVGTVLVDHANARCCGDFQAVLEHDHGSTSPRRTYIPPN